MPRRIPVCTDVPRVADVRTLVDTLNDPAGPPFAFCEVPGACVTPEQINAEHEESVGHLLRPGSSPPGQSMPFRTALAFARTAPVFEGLIDAGVDVPHIHPERAWVHKGPRAFQACNTRCTVDLGGFRKIDAPESARHILLPHTRGRPILFGLAGCANGMCAPHGVAKSAKDNTASEWHAEPGGIVWVFVVANGPDGSAGFYLKFGELPVDNLAKRLELVARDKFRGVHDQVLLDWLLAKLKDGVDREELLELANFVCMASGGLPVTWCGHFISDPLCIKGCGRPANIKKLIDADTGYRLPRGEQVLDDHSFGSPPPQMVRDFVADTAWRFRDLHKVAALAQTHPRVFAAYFRTWTEPSARPAKVARRE